MAIDTATVPAQLKSLALFGGTPITGEPVQMISVKLEEEDIQAATAVMRSGMLAAGKVAQEFEAKFAEMSGAKHAFACANGTVALQLAYGATIERGDEVLCPSWTYIATASMLAAAGAKIVWVDADPTTYSIDVNDAAKKVNERTTAIAATHLYGNPVDISAVNTLAANEGLHVIYDAAQAHLSTYQGKGIGAYGDLSTYSFYPTKNMTTGEGGMVTTNDDELAEKVRLLRSHGEVAKYTHASIGFNYRMTDMEAAIGLSQLKRLPGYTQTRRDNAAFYTNALASIDGLHAPVETADAESCYHLYAVRIDESAFITPEDGRCVRDHMIEALSAEGIRTAVHYPMSLTRQPVFATPGVQHQAVSDQLSRSLFCIPIHQNLTELQLSQVAEAMAKVADAYRA